MKHNFREKHNSASKRISRPKEDKKNKLNQLTPFPEYYAFQEKNVPLYKGSQAYTISTNYNRKSSLRENKIYSIGDPNLPSLKSKKANKIPNHHNTTKYNLNEELTVVSELWNDLEMKDKYQKLFESSIGPYTKTIRSKLINLESETLRRMKASLTKLSKEILSREKAITLIQRINELVCTNVSQGIKELNESILKDLIKAFKTLRIHSINVVNHIKKCKETYHSYLSYLKSPSDSQYNSSYLDKMKTDLNFLSKSCLSYYFSFDKESDPFLLSLSAKEEIARPDNNNYSKYPVQINADIMEAIIHCEYFMLQESLQSKMRDDKDGAYLSEKRNSTSSMPTMDVFKENKKRDSKFNPKKRHTGVNISQMMSQLKQSPDYNRMFLASNGFKKKEKSDSFNKDSERKKVLIEKEGLQVMSRKELLKKFDEFEKAQIDYETENDNKSEQTKSNQGRQYKVKEENKYTSDYKNKSYIESKDLEDEYHMASTNNNIKTSDYNKPPNEVKRKENVSNSSMNEIKENNSSQENECKVDYTIEFYTESLSSFIAAYRDYYAKIPIPLRTTFNISATSAIDLLQGVNPKLIIALSKDDNPAMIGLCHITYESFPSQPLKVRILHLSCISSNWRTVFKSIIEYIKVALDYDVIELSLYYHYSNNHFIMNKDILSLFKEQLGFKWQKIENKSNNQRVQFLTYLNEKEREQDFIPPAILSINTTSVLTLSKTPSEQSMTFGKYLNTFSLQFLLNAIREQGYKMFSLNKPQESWNSQDIQLNFPDIVYQHNPPSEGLQKALKQLYSIDDISIKHNNPSSLPQVSCCSIDYKPKLNSHYSLTHNGVIYNRLQGNIGILIDKNIEQKVYLIPTEDKVNSLLICEMTSEMKELFLNCSGNIYDIFVEYYLRLSHDANEKTFSSSLWIPSFHINSHLIASNASCLEDVKMEDSEGIEAYVNRIDEYISVSYSSTTSLKTNFLITPEENDIIIKDPFLFGLINSNLLSRVKIPAIVFLLVTQHHWNAVDKLKENK